MKVFARICQIILAILFGLIAGFSTLLLLPFLFLYAGIKIIGGMASKI